MIAALYVEANGCYANLPDVEVWDITRDARTYAGPHPVVAHPPCERWGRYWFGSPSSEKRFRLGDDDGCFESAIAAVRRCGGVLEHPAGTAAWGVHGITCPQSEGWCVADFWGGFTCEVEQGHFGHRARKATWLYFHAGVHQGDVVKRFVMANRLLPSLPWGPSTAKLVRQGPARGGSNQRAGVVRHREGVEMMGHAERKATPLPFRDLLLSMARSVRRIEESAE